MTTINHVGKDIYGEYTDDDLIAVVIRNDERRITDIEKITRFIFGLSEPPKIIAELEGFSKSIEKHTEHPVNWATIKEKKNSINKLSKALNKKVAKFLNFMKDSLQERKFEVK